MTREQFTKAGLLEKLREFDRVASTLDMPVVERLGILNVDQAAYEGLHGPSSHLSQYLTPELDRRMTYALPLMRKLASNMPVSRFRLVESCAA